MEFKTNNCYRQSFWHLLACLFLGGLILSLALSVSAAKYDVKEMDCWFLGNFPNASHRCYLFSETFEESFSNPLSDPFGQLFNKFEKKSELKNHNNKSLGLSSQFTVIVFSSNNEPNKKPPLLHLGAGGPGASLFLQTQKEVEEFLDSYRAFSLDVGRDLVVIDVRGSVNSDVDTAPNKNTSNLVCSEYIDAFSMSVSKPLNFDAQTQIFSQAYSDCYDRQVKLDNNLNHLNSERIVQDVEFVRGFLGISKWSLYGVSYAARYGLYYAHTFPNNTDKIILDSPLLFNGDLDVVSKYHQYFSMVIDRCVKTLCANSESEKKDLERRLFQLLQMVDRNSTFIPVPAELRVLVNEEKIYIDIDRLITIFTLAFYDEREVAYLADVIFELENNTNKKSDKNGKADRYHYFNRYLKIWLEQEFSTEFSDVSYLSHYCAETFPYLNLMNKVEANPHKASRDYHRSIFSAYYDRVLQRSKAYCDVWPIEVKDNPVSKSVTIQAPILFLFGSLDPVSYPWQGIDLRRRYSTSETSRSSDISHHVIMGSLQAREAAARFLNYE